MGRNLGRSAGLIVSQRICRNSDRFIFGSKYLWVGGYGKIRAVKRPMF
ncbi:hypothetical protein LEP1GSC036_3187 [Leptospira weilii str. 2006001853]|uniref:Uncharacterized protein n=3 Tax=Leptospira weilii TaxID=28184 RepID=A0A828Z0I0_9LEPT|nr:hypothetical protein LEP1GSC036_3187 [Leptospira weilii str. 2006001853]EMM72482.1 hypothetical protein LEP1GSC038_3368 [Leptospira weilii str. 2006001855]EMN43543.1 hypothetical protein LEP1GSC086_0627 [Leptospira weilii str. LNT 1234]EMN90964.1 hypothetical protein LEP1GSC108_4361 [Leptospira weilii str. UI 13098]